MVWKSAYPQRRQIIDEIVKLWERYDLERRTNFQFRVNRVLQDCEKRWIINDSSHGTFDGVIVAVGTCGNLKTPWIANQEHFNGQILHSSQLDGLDPRGKKVVIVGGGASAAEAAEFVIHKGAAEVSVLSRVGSLHYYFYCSRKLALIFFHKSEKWILPRNILIQRLFALNVFGRDSFLYWIPEILLRRYFYRDLQDLAPTDKGVFTQSPLVNSALFSLIRSGKLQWLRGKIENFEENGLRFHCYSKGVNKGVSDKGSVVEGDMIIMATGYQRPNFGFLPPECSKTPYAPPNWYLQTFPPKHFGVCAINSTYVEGIASIGNYHIGIYTRILIMFLLDPHTQPRERQAKAWIDGVRWLKSSQSPVGAFDFVTFGELHVWFFFCMAINPFRWKWLLFVFFSNDMHLFNPFIPVMPRWTPLAKQVV